MRVHADEHVRGVLAIRAGVRLKVRGVQLGGQGPVPGEARRGHGVKAAVADGVEGVHAGDRCDCAAAVGGDRHRVLLVAVDVEGERGRAVVDRVPAELVALVLAARDAGRPAVGHCDLGPRRPVVEAGGVPHQSGIDHGAHVDAIPSPRPVHQQQAADSSAVRVGADSGGVPDAQRQNRVRCRCAVLADLGKCRARRAPRQGAGAHERESRDARRWCREGAGGLGQHQRLLEVRVGVGEWPFHDVMRVHAGAAVTVNIHSCSILVCVPDEL